MIRGILPAFAALFATGCSRRDEETVDLTAYRTAKLDACGGFFETAPTIEPGIAAVTDFAAFSAATNDGTTAVAPGFEDDLEGRLVLHSWDMDQVPDEVHSDYLLAEGKFLGYEVGFDSGGFPWAQALWCPLASPDRIGFLGVLEDPALPGRALLATLAQCDPETDEGCAGGEANYGSSSLIAGLRGSLYDIAPGSCNIEQDEICPGELAAETNFVRIPDNLMNASD